MKNPNDTIGNQSRELTACSAVPQPTAPPRVPCLLCSPDVRNQETMKSFNIARLPTVEQSHSLVGTLKTSSLYSCKRNPLYIGVPDNIPRYVSHRRRTDLFVLIQSLTDIDRITGIARARLVFVVSSSCVSVRLCGCEIGPVQVKEGRRGEDSSQGGEKEIVQEEDTAGDNHN